MERSPARLLQFGAQTRLHSIHTGASRPEQKPPQSGYTQAWIWGTVLQALEGGGDEVTNVQWQKTACFFSEEWTAERSRKEHGKRQAVCSRFTCRTTVNTRRFTFMSGLHAPSSLLSKFTGYIHSTKSRGTLNALKYRVPSSLVSDPPCI